MEISLDKAILNMERGFSSNLEEKIIVTAGLFSIFNETRGYYQINEAGPLFLFLLTLEHYGYLEDGGAYLSLDAVLNSKKANGLPYSELFRDIYNNGDAIINSEDTLIVHFSTQLDKVKGKMNRKLFPTIFEGVLSRIYNIETKLGGNYLLTSQVRWLMEEAASVKDNAEVFNPFAGLGSFGMDLPSSASFYGQEINTYAYDLARLRASAHGKYLKENFKLELGDTFLNWPAHRKFDLIISNPPFGIKLNRYSSDVSSLRSAQNFLISEGVKLLKPKGKLVTLVSEGFLYRGGKEAITRRFLIENDLIETVFAIPQGLLIGTSVASAILVINGDKKSVGKIKFSTLPIYYSDELGIGGERESEDSITQLNQLDDPGFSPDPFFAPEMALVANDHIVKHNFNLTPKRHLLTDVTGTPLNELLTPLPGTSIKGKYSGYLTTIKDLITEESQEYRVSFPVLSEVDMATGQYILPRGTRKLDNGALLIAVAGRTLKASYFSPRRKDGKRFPLYLSPQVKAFEFDWEKLDYDYLIHQLRSELVKKQLEAYQTGTGIPRLSVEDFLRIRIQLPSLEEQELTMRAFNAVNKKMEALIQERNALAHGAKMERNTRFATLKHAFGRPQQSILSAAKTIKDYLEHMGERGEKLNREYAEFFEQERSVSGTLQGIINDVDFISRLMDRGENGLQVDSYQLIDHSLTSVLKAVKGLSATGFKFKLKVRAEQTKEWDKLSVSINKQLLRVLLDNLLTNADKHGFTEKAPGNLVQITLSVIGYNLVLEVQNNGAAFPLNFGKEQLIQEFKTNSVDLGQGIGGHQVDQIAKRFGGPDWELLTEANEIFPVTFIFRFPISETVVTIDNDGKIDPHE
jgi:type I restriction enzyme M protein